MLASDVKVNGTYTETALHKDNPVDNDDVVVVSTDGDFVTYAYLRSEEYRLGGMYDPHRGLPLSIFAERFSPTS